MGYVTGIVPRQPLRQILRQTCVETFWMQLTFQLCRHMHGLPGRSSEWRDGWPGFALAGFRRGRLRSSRRSERSLVPRGRFELPTYGLGNRCSVQLSYRGQVLNKPVNIEYNQCFGLFRAYHTKVA
jgi:hypothetical protein